MVLPKMKVAIIGCGLIGGKRARFLGHHELVSCADVDLARAQKLADACGGTARALVDWRPAISDQATDIVIVATTPDVMAEITIAALQAGKHVLVDKPAGRNQAELLPVLKAKNETGRQVHLGFNHRYHPAIAKAHALVEDGAVGELMYIRGRYGHGARLGYEKEWRAQPDIAGGGELLDQGSHLIDLSRWFLGELSYEAGTATTAFWDMAVEDNAFLFLRSKRNQVAWLHASWTEWKNLFSFEIFGKTGKLMIDGLGGSYGTETLTFYKMKPELGPPDLEKWEFSGPDTSWENEFNQFIDDIQSGRQSGPGIEDALAVMRIAAAVYSQNPALSGAAR
jgi:predicted dehydrogenase